MIKYGATSGLRRDWRLGPKAHIPHGDSFVIEAYSAYRERWEIWGFAASHSEAQTLLDHASGSAERARVRRLQ